MMMPPKCVVSLPASRGWGSPLLAHRVGSARGINSVALAGGADLSRGGGGLPAPGTPTSFAAVSGERGGFFAAFPFGETAPRLKNPPFRPRCAAATAETAAAGVHFRRTGRSHDINL